MRKAELEILSKYGIYRNSIILEEEDYHQILERFNVKKVIRIGNKYKILIECGLCPKHPNCKGCPFKNYFKNWEESINVHAVCVYLMRIVVGEAPIQITKNYIEWNIQDDREARIYINKIRQILMKKFKQV